VFKDFINQTISDIENSELKFNPEDPNYFVKVMDRAMQMDKQRADLELRSEKPTAKEKDQMRKMILNKSYFEKVNGGWNEVPIELSKIADIKKKFAYPDDLGDRVKWDKWVSKISMEDFLWIKNILRGE
jgi:hypothetical protein